MERLLGKKKITALLFLAFLFGFAVLNTRKELPILQDALTSWRESGGTPAELIAQIGSAIDENVVEKYTFIDAYGYIQLILGKEEESNFEVVKDHAGKLYYTYFTTEINDVSEEEKPCGRRSGERGNAYIRDASGKIYPWIYRIFYGYPLQYGERDGG